MTQPLNDHCPKCRHPWDFHGGDGCQNQVQLGGGWYDCNCQERYRRASGRPRSGQWGSGQGPSAG